MAEDWASDVRKYAPDADDAVIAGIVRYCGIALRNRDSSLVSFSDPTETARVRNNFCRKKLGLTEPDADLDAAIQRVGERMKEDRTRNRVTVYYLLAEAFDRLELFRGKAKAATGSGAKKAPSVATRAAAAALPLAAAPSGTSAPAPAPAEPAVAPSQKATPAAAASASAKPMGLAGAGSASSPAARQAGTAKPDHDDWVGFALAAIAAVVLVFIAAMVIGNLAAGRKNATEIIPPQTPEQLKAASAASAAVPVPAAPAAAVAVPQGAAAIGAEVAGKPKVSVYFDTGSQAIAADFAAVAAPLKAWLDAHPGARLAVSGFNDPTGNAALNAELSKERAKAVAAALAGIGVNAAAIDLVKPAETTDALADPAQARRVDVTVSE